MLEQGKIDGKQAVMLMISMVLPTVILMVPSIVVNYAGQDAWLSLMLATLAGLLISWLVVSLSLRFAGKTLIEYAEEILGKVAGKIVGLLYIWWFLHLNSVVILEFGEFLSTATMPDTPIIIFHILVVAVAAYAVRNGLEVLSRFNQLILPIIGLFLVIIFILSAPNMKFVRLLPPFDAGMLSIVQGAAVPTSWLGEIVTLAMIIPFLNKPKEAYRIAFLSILLIGFFLTASVLMSLLIFGPDLTSAWIFPTFNSVRVISVANFLERLESLIIMIWVLGGIIKVGVFYYAAVLGSAQWFGLKDYKPLVTPVGVILVALAMLSHESVVDLLDFIAMTWPPYALIFEAGFPLLLLLVALARGKRGERG